VYIGEERTWKRREPKEKRHQKRRDANREKTSNDTKREETPRKGAR
jgi:hypothetical protein